MAKKIADNDKKSSMLFKCYKANRDSVDLFNSMQVYYNKSLPPEIQVDPNVQLLRDLSSKIDSDTYDYIKDNLESKKVQMLFKIFKQNNDEADLINSMDRVYRKANPVAAAPDTNKENPDNKVLESLKLAGEVTEFAKAKLANKDKKMVTLFKCFNMNQDSSDLANSITRYF